MTQFLQCTFRCGIIRSRKGCLSFAALILYGVGCGKLPISVWLGAKLTRIQFTRLPDSRTTGSAQNG